MAEMEGKLEGIAADLPSQLKQLEGCKFQGIYKGILTVFSKERHLVDVKSPEVIEMIKKILTLDPPGSPGEKYWKGITKYNGEWVIWAYEIEGDDKYSGRYIITEVEKVKKEINWQQKVYRGLFNIYLKAE
jgi:hypothetical protein